MYLFKDKRFLPIFIVQFCGSLNDSIIKNAVIILVTFKLASCLKIDSYMMVMLANILFTAPFIIFASLAGQIADRYERATLVKIIKGTEVAVVLLAAYGFIHENLAILFTCLALMGIHSTFFGPIKYSALPDQLEKEELLGANGYIEAATFLSILIGTIIGGYYTFSSSTIITLAGFLSITGLITSFFVPASGNVNKNIKINPNIWQESVNIIRYASSRTKLYLTILGVSWFWFIGAAILAQIPLLTRETLGADETVANLFIMVFSLGVGVGSFCCNKVFGNKLTTKYVFISAIGISLCGIDLYFATRIAEINYQPEHLKSIAEFLSNIYYWRILVDLFFLSVAGGLYVVPLYANMQYFTPAPHRSRVLATNNLISAIFMAGQAAILSLLFALNFSVPSVILIISIMNFIVALHIYRLAPKSKIMTLHSLQSLLKILINCVYRVEIKGLENYKKAGKRAVIIANHVSYIDPPIIACYIPEKIPFAINMTIAKKWWIKPFLLMAKTYPIEPTNPMAIKSLIDEVKKDSKIAIFPEGRISVTGTLMKVYEGPAMIADKADATILPIRVDGVQYTRFSKIRKFMKTEFVFRRKLTITILPPVKVNPPAKLNSRDRRKYISQILYDIMSDMMFESTDYKKTLLQSFIETANLFGMSKKILQDADNNKISYRSILFRSFLLGSVMARNAQNKTMPPGKAQLNNTTVGLMLPTSSAAIISFFALQAFGIVPVMINFTSGAQNIISSCKTALVDTVYTSRMFIKKTGLQDLTELLIAENIRLIYLEDLHQTLKIGSKIKALIGSFMPAIYYKYTCKNHNADDMAVILFTSGTENRPKAVALSHANIQANRYQVMSIIDFTPGYDLAFNALPLFHSFGLTTTMIMMLGGVQSFVYTSPLHYRIIPELVYYSGATIMFGTDTFLSSYAEAAHPYDFYSLRYVIAGAEKLREKTRQTWLDKFGIRILEGYGVTETAPVIAVNTPMHYKAGTIGRFLPKIEHFLKPIEGIENAGSLCIKGPNVMLGYMTGDDPGVIKQPVTAGLSEGWHDTGDIASVDSDGYITILGRYKRFAKIAGEMVSLQSVEELAYRVDESGIHAAVSAPDDKKGEKVILFTTSNKLTLESFIEATRLTMVSKLYIPKDIRVMASIPILASGKIDYVKLTEMI